jgi:antitoxin component YwqK of YwqJK toxin-antitoxin module
MDTRYQSSIPAAAIERVTSTHEDGTRAGAEYALDGEVVGKRFWDKDGSLAMEIPLKGGARHGIEYRWSNGFLLSAEPYVDGRAHGTAQQWDDAGRLIGTYTLVHGTGIDLWWGEREDESICLAEVHHMKDGSPHGFEWWVNDDQRSVWQERHWKERTLHGIERVWNLQGRLRRGYPRYWVDGQKVTKRQYLRACKTDEALPPFRAEENAPERTFPPEIRTELSPP